MICRLVAVTSLFLTSPVFVSAATSDVEVLIADFDKAAIAAHGYSQQIARARGILDAGKKSNDAELKARGLIRMAFAEITCGKWGGNWASWRQRATTITSELDDSFNSYTEVKGLNGFLRGMYFDEMRQGIDDLRAAAVASANHNDDSFTTLAYYCLARLLIIDGQDSDALRAMKISELFARNAKHESSELAILQNRIAHIEGFRLRPRTESLERLRELCRRLDRDSIFLLSESDRIARYTDVVSNFSKMPTEKTANASEELRHCLFASHKLVTYFQQRNDWGQVVRFQQIFSKCAERLKDPTSMALADAFDAGVLAHRGEFEKANEAMNRFIEHKKAVSREQDISYQCSWFADQMRIGGDVQSAALWLRRSGEYRDRSSLGRTAHLSAHAYVDSVMSDRKLRLRNRKQADALQTQRWIMVILTAVGGGCFLVYSSYRGRLEKTRLQQQVRSRTAALKEAKEHAEKQNKTKTEFVARINHEIRNPMTAIVACGELIASNTLAFEEQESIRQTLLASSKSLLGLLTDVLDFTQIESGEVTIKEERFSPRALLDSTASIVRPSLKSDVELRQVLGHGLPESLVADAKKLSQVLINLGQNSARHTSKGFVEFGCEIQANELGECKLRWTVRDSGVGMSSKQSSELRSTDQPGEAHSGTGIGLAICESFVTAMNGSISYCVNDLGGTTTTFVVPCRLANDLQVDASTDEPHESHPARVLVVDDDDGNRVLVTRLLRTLGYEPYSAGTWEEVEMTLNAHPINCVLLDLRMPRMNGFEMLRRIRDLSSAAKTLVLAVTGDATQTRKDQAAAAGFDGFLSKPFTLDQLKQFIEQGQASVPSQLTADTETQ